MAVEKVYQPYDEQVYNSIPKQQPQTKPEKKTDNGNILVLSCHLIDVMPKMGH